MNKIKCLYIILLSILFMNNNIISMQDQDYITSEQESQLLSLPAELTTAIINETVIQQVKKTINEWNDIFQEPKINLQEIGLVSQQFKDVLNVALKSPSLKNYLNQLVKELKSKRFDELFENLKHQSIEQYRDLSTQALNNNLFNILKKREISTEGFKVAVKLILSGADANARDKKGRTTLMWASIYGYKNIVKILIKAGAYVNVKSDDGSTALINTARDGHKEIVELLLANKADVNVTDEDSRTSLMFASKYGRKEIVEMLIKAGAKVNATDDYGNTALMMASREDYKEIIEMLKEAGAK